MLLIENEDPGSEYINIDRTVLQNANRQILSTINGLRFAETEFSIKIRSDIKFFNNRIIEVLNENQTLKRITSDYTSSRGFISIVNVTSINPRKRISIPFHYCDWIYMGQTKDLNEIFDISLFQETEWCRWFINHRAMDADTMQSLSRYATEAYIILQYVSKKIKLQFDHNFDNVDRNIIISEKVLINNFRIHTLKDLGVRNLKNKIND